MIKVIAMATGARGGGADARLQRAAGVGVLSSMLYRGIGAAMVIAGCTPSPPDAWQRPTPVAPPARRQPPEPALEPAGLGPPWEAISEWDGVGIPPKQLSLFDIPPRSPVLAYAALDRAACEGELRR